MKPGSRSLQTARGAGGGGWSGEQKLQVSGEKGDQWGDETSIELSADVGEKERRSKVR